MKQVNIHLVPVTYDEVDFSWMAGRLITGVTFDEPNFWRFWLNSSEHIAVECLWRIVRDGHIICTSEDHDQMFGLGIKTDAAQQAAKLLAGAVVTAVHLRRFTADLSIDHEGGVGLEIIPDSSGYESWQVCAPNDLHFVACGGGQICRWTPCTEGGQPG